METNEFNFNDYHRKFISATQQYHQRQSTYVGKDDWHIEVENRFAIMGQLSDLLTYLSDKSYCLVNTFFNSIKNDPRKSILMDKELELFTDIVSSLFNLMSHKEDISKWSYELLMQKKYLQNDKEQPNKIDR